MKPSEKIIDYRKLLTYFLLIFACFSHVVGNVKLTAMGDLYGFEITSV